MMAALHIRYGTGLGVPADVLISAIPSLPRPLLARLTERMIDRLDELDEDPDLEANGDELDGTGAEDDFVDHGGFVGAWGGPGCPVSDPPEEDDDDRCEAADDGCRPVYYNGRLHWGARDDDPE